MLRRIILIVFVVFLFAGCDSYDYIEDFKNSEYQTKESSPEASSIKESCYDKYARLSYGNSMYATDNKGLFYIDNAGENANMRVNYYSYSDNTSVIWCNKLDCKHNSAECTAVVSPNESRPGDYFFQYHHDKAYKLIDDESGIDLYQFNPDGSNQIKIADLYPKELSGVRINSGCFYNNRYYYSVIDENSDVHFYQLELRENSEPQKLITQTYHGEKLLNTAFYVNDKGMYFWKNFPEGTVKHPNILCKYDFEHQTVTEIFECNDGVRLCVNDDIYFLSDKNGLYKLNEKNQAELVWSSKALEINKNVCDIYANSKYIVIDYHSGIRNFVVEGKRSYYIYDIENKTMEQFRLPEAIYQAKSEADYINSFMYVTGIDGSYLYLVQRNQLVGNSRKDVVLLVDLCIGADKKFDYYVIYL